MVLKSSFVLFAIVFLFWGSVPSKGAMEEVYATLSIPSLELQEPIYLKESKYNDLQYGLYLLPSADYLEGDSSQMIVLSHSGNSKISYFKDLDLLRIQDRIVVSLKETVYFFKVLDIYQEEKDGEIAIKKPKEMSLVLVTCTKYTDHLQTVVIAKNVGKLIKM